MDREQMYRRAIEAAQAILLRYLPPNSGLSAEQAIVELFHVLDRRDLIKAMRNLP